MSTQLGSQERWHEIFGVAAPVAFVTGSAANRVGRRIATELQAAGFRVVFHSHRGASDSHEELILTGGIESEDSVQQWIQQIYDTHGRCDVVVNSAAIWDPVPLESVTASHWKRNWEVNALGTALVAQHFGLTMVKQEYGGCIVNISDWATRRPYRDFAAYFPTKAAVNSITESLAVELALRNPRIRVNAILPGPVLLADEIKEARRQQIIAECLLKREGSAEDVARAALFLVSSPFVTGVCLPVDGGRSIYAGPSADASAHPDA